MCELMANLVEMHSRSCSYCSPVRGKYGLGTCERFAVFDSRREDPPSGPPPRRVSESGKQVYIPRQCAREEGYRGQTEPGHEQAISALRSIVRKGGGRSWTQGSSHTSRR